MLDTCAPLVTSATEDLVPDLVVSSLAVLAWASPWPIFETCAALY